MKLEEPTPEQLAQEDLQRRLNWEQGNIDYMGIDSFDNIWNKITQSLSQVEEPQVSGEVLDAVSPAATTVSPTPVTSITAIPFPPVSVPSEPAQKPAPLETTTPVDPPKTVSPPATQSEIKSSPPSGLLDLKEILEKVKETEVPASPSQKEAQPVTPSQVPVSPSQKETQLPVTPSQKQAEPSVTPSSVSQPQPESAPVCVKPSSVEEQKSQLNKEVAPTEEAPPKSLPQGPKPSTELSSITLSSPKSPEVPTAVPDLSKKSSAEVQSTETTTSTSTGTKCLTPATEPAPVEAKTEPSVPAQSTPTAQETKSKQTPKSGGGKKK